jgi:hypothetical protein
MTERARAWAFEQVGAADAAVSRGRGGARGGNQRIHGMTRSAGAVAGPGP